MKYALLIFVTLTGFVAMAQSGTAGGGGGEAAGTELLDVVIARNITPLTTAEVTANPSFVKFLKNADAVAFKFSSYMVSSKKWFFVKNISPEILANCKNGSPTIVDSKVVACQKKENYIFINANWFYSKFVSEQTRAALIAHELYVGLAQRYGLYDNIDSKRNAEFEIQLFNGNAFGGKPLAFEDMKTLIYRLTNSQKTLIDIEEGRRSAALLSINLHNNCEKEFNSPTKVAATSTLRAGFTLSEATNETIYNSIYSKISDMIETGEEYSFRVQMPLLCELVKKLP